MLLNQGTLPKYKFPPMVLLLSWRKIIYKNTKMDVFFDIMELCCLNGTRKVLVYFHVNAYDYERYTVKNFVTLLKIKDVIYSMKKLQLSSSLFITP